MCKRLDGTDVLYVVDEQAAIRRCVVNGTPVREVEKKKGVRNEEIGRKRGNGAPRCRGGMPAERQLPVKREEEGRLTNEKKTP